MKQRLEIMARDWKGLVLGAIISILLITYATSRITPIEVISTPNKPIIVYPGKRFTLCRTVRYKRAVNMEMSKAMIKNMGTGEYITINFPKVFFHRKKGIQTICREMMIPEEIELGDWELHTYLVAKQAPFWSLEVEAPIVKLFVANSEGNECHTK